MKYLAILLIISVSSLAVNAQWGTFGLFGTKPGTAKPAAASSNDDNDQLEVIKTDIVSAFRVLIGINTPKAKELLNEVTAMMKEIDAIPKGDTTKRSIALGKVKRSFPAKIKIIQTKTEEIFAKYVKDFGAVAGSINGLSG